MTTTNFTFSFTKVAFFTQESVFVYRSSQFHQQKLTERTAFHFVEMIFFLCIEIIKNEILGVTLKGSEISCIVVAHLKRKIARETFFHVVIKKSCGQGSLWLCVAIVFSLEVHYPSVITPSSRAVCFLKEFFNVLLSFHP